MRCHNCGATLPLGALTCGYCQAPAPHAQQVVEQQQRQADASAAAARARLHRTAWMSLGLSALGLIACCVPSGIVGLVQGLRAKRLAREQQTSTPLPALFGVAVGALSLFTTVAAFGWAYVDNGRDQERAEARRTVLEAELTEPSRHAELQQETACKLVELYLLHARVGEHRAPLFEPRCLGALRVEAERAYLPTVRVAVGSSKHIDVNVCLQRGAAWFVTEAAEEGKPLSCALP